MNSSGEKKKKKQKRKKGKKKKRKSIDQYATYWFNDTDLTSDILIQIYSSMPIRFPKERFLYSYRVIKTNRM